jgi:AAA15 family ATPase/GTPase
MKLSSIKIVNFRSIKEAEIDFSDFCRILLGKNESGKSNILKAISLIDSKNTPKPEDVREFAFDEDVNQESFIEFKFNLEPNEAEDVYLNVAEKYIFFEKPEEYVLSHASKKLTLREVCERENVGFYAVKLHPEPKRFSNYEDNSSEYLANEDFLVFKTEASITEVELTTGIKLKKSVSYAIHKNLIPEELRENFRTANPYDFIWAIGQALKNLVLKSLPKCIFWEYSENNLLPGTIDRDGFVADPNTCLPLKYLFNLAGYGDASQEIQNSMKFSNRYENLLARVAHKATEHLRETWREYKDVEIHIIPDGDQIKATIKDKNLRFDLSRRSDGFKRFITFLIYISAQVKSDNLKKTIYLHDEPDASLHPSGARYLRDELINISKNQNYVIFSTHSTHMVDRKNISRHVIVKKKNEITTTKNALGSNIKDEEVLYNAVGASIFDDLKPLNLIFEGWRDKKLLTVFMENKNLDKELRKNLADLGLCHVRGVKSIELIVPMLDLANREWIVISDSDQVAIEKRVSLIQEARFEGRWFLYNDLCENVENSTAEDFIENKKILSAMEKVCLSDSKLRVIEPEQLEIHEPKVKIIERFVKSLGYSSNEVKSILNQIKDYIFEDLTPSDIKANYLLAMKKLSDLIKK